MASLARTSPGARALLDLVPAFEEPAVRELLAETSEMWDFRARNGRLPLAGVEDVSALLAALRDSGGAANPEDFRSILAAARAAEAVRRALVKAESPHLSRRREAMPGFVPLLGSARRLFDTDGTIKDSASPALHDVRTKLRRRRTEVSRSLNRLLDERRDFLGDAVVVLRNDRYCLPVLASARARVPGIVHDRSGSGQTVFVEPIDVIESNNELALLAGEERREVERLLAEFGQEVLAAGDDLENAVAQMASLDALEAKVEFGEKAAGRIPELSEDGSWTIAAARHPLLDPLLAPLRRSALGETPAGRPARAREIVPLDLDLPAEKRLLSVSGPNAGGKTVVLKTAGLFSLMAQAGLPLPCGPATRLPVFAAIHAEIGDAQEIMAGRSTFSSSMEALAAILRDSSPGRLALIDEIGGSTDPEEGSALAIAFLEEYLERGGRALVTTHFSALKNFAAGRADAVGAAMEFDEETGRPNYRLHPGLSGRSRALSVAREQGLPETVLRRSREILGEAWRRRELQESEAEAAIERLRESERDLARERETARRVAEKLGKERESRAAEHARMLAEGLAGFERARADLARRVDSEIQALRSDASRRAEASTERLLARAEAAGTAEPVVAEALEKALARTRAIAPGERARIRGSKTAGVVLSLDQETAWLEVAGKRMRVARVDLEALGGVPEAPPGKKQVAAAAPLAGPEPVNTATLEVNVIGQRIDDALPEIEKRLDEALLAGAGRLRIIHGHGSGRLRDAVREHFREHPAVASLRAGDAREGGNGATIVELR